MAYPKHKNPRTKERAAHAPYNFVPLPDKVVTVRRNELPPHDRYGNPHHTGYIDCTLLTETPLYIRCPFTPDEFKKLAEQERQERERNKQIPLEEKIANTPYFFYTDEQSKNEQTKEAEPVIPGSSLRGMLRALIEIVGYGKIEAVSQQKLLYRAVADPTLGREYRQMMSRAKAGYVTERNGRFWIIPAREVDRRTLFKIREETLRKLNFQGFEPMYNYDNGRRGEPNKNYRPQYLRPIWFQPPRGRDDRGRPFDTVREREVSHKPVNHYQQGTVVCSGFIEGKGKHIIVTAKSDIRALEIPNQVVRDYQESLTEFQQGKPFSKRFGCLRDENEKSVERPIFYLERNGVVEWIGHTPNFRIPYRQGASFRITEQSLASLKSEGVPGDVLEKLQRIKNQEVIAEDRFLDLLKTAIGDGQTVRFKSLILKHAHQGNSIATPGDFVPEALRREDDLDIAESIFGFSKETKSFRITEQSLASLKSEGVPGDVLEKLQRIKNQEVIAEDRFLDLLKTAIGDGQTVRFKSLILKHATKGRKTDAHASRVFVTDARLLPGQTDRYLSREPIRPHILAGPKPTTFQHYLVQTNPDNRAELKHYGSIPSKETVIRGHKLYWHQGKIFLDDIEAPETEATDQEEKPDTQHTLMKPLRAGLRFQFRIYFENLSEVELGALFWVLRLPGVNPDNYRHKLGMGKPYGMGSVKLESKLHLTDRQPRPDRSARYDRLFEEDDSWATGRMSVPEEINVAAQSLKEFEQEVLRQVAKNEQQGGRLADLERIRTLLRLLEWPGLEDRDLSGYMSIERKEYRNRPVLPTPVPLIHKRGITRARIKNYKSLVDVDVRLGKLTILVGTNASGKSNFIYALRFVAEAIDDLNKAINEDRGGISLIRRWSPNSLPVGITLEFEDDLLRGEYHFEITSEGNNYRVTREHGFVWVENEWHVYEIIDGLIQPPPLAEDWVKVVPSPALVTPSFPTDALALKVASQLFPFKEAAALLSSVHLYAIDPKALRQPQAADESPKSLNKEGSNLGSIWRAMEHNESELLDEIQHELRVALPGVTEVKIKPDGKELVIEFQHDWNGVLPPPFEARLESDGTLRLLGLLTSLFQEPAPALVAIEEPENTIHPGLLRTVYRVLSETSQERSQVVITTHSPDLLMQASVGDLRAVEIEDGVTSIGEIEETQREAIRERLVSVGEIMRMEGISREP